MGPEDAEAERWDRFYAGEDDDAPRWSGEPNATLVAEVAELASGTALDVGCGEGADAVWLARRGWQVTGIDPSHVALERARAAARASGVEVTWIRSGLRDLAEDDGPYDLVTAHYAVVPRSDDGASIAALVRAVAPGGTLLVVHHDLDPVHGAEHATERHDAEHATGQHDAEHANERHDAEHDALLTPGDVAAHLGDGWRIEVAGPRENDGHHVSGHERPRDVVLRARRR